MTTKKRLTTAQLKRLESAAMEGYKQGLEVGTLRGRQEALENSSMQDKQLKRDQVAAVTALITATTVNLSKAGYLLSQLNK